MLGMKKTILVAAKQPAWQETAKDIFKREYKVILADNLQSAEEKARVWIDAALIDSRLEAPDDPNDASAISLMRTLHSDGIPVVVVFTHEERWNRLFGEVPWRLNKVTDDLQAFRDTMDKVLRREDRLLVVREPWFIATLILLLIAVIVIYLVTSDFNSIVNVLVGASTGLITSIVSMVMWTRYVRTLGRRRSGR